MKSEVFSLWFACFRFYSLVGPGDTIIAIGEFDEQGKCVVDHDNNLIIIHPDILLSGTRVKIVFHSLIKNLTFYMFVFFTLSLILMS